MKKHGNEAFTLIELIIVIVIIGILAAIAIPKFTGTTDAAKIAATKGALSAVRSAIAVRYAQSATNSTGPSYPSSISSTDFVNNSDPRNEVNAKTGVVTVTQAPSSGTATSSSGFWYVSSGTDAGRAGAYSDGTVDTSVF